MRRVASIGTSRRERATLWVPLEPTPLADMYRPARLLEVGAEYEVIVGDKVWYRFTVDEGVDVTPPAFAGARSAAFRRYSYSGIACDHGEPREIVIEHDDLPRDVAFTVVSVRRQDAAGPAWQEITGVGDASRNGRRDRTLLSSDTCIASPPPPPIERGATYCLSIAAYDAAGNAAGGDVEVCKPVMQCDVGSWTCPPRAGEPVYDPTGDPEVVIKNIEVAGWLRARLRPFRTPLGVVFVLAAWRIRRRRRQVMI